MYAQIGNKVIFIHINKETHDVAECADAQTAFKAAKLMDKAGYLNDIKRKYTASARLYAQAEQLPGFRWITIDA